MQCAQFLFQKIIFNPTISMLSVQVLGTYCLCFLCLLSINLRYEYICNKVALTIVTIFIGHYSDFIKKKEMSGEKWYHFVYQDM